MPYTHVSAAPVLLARTKCSQNAARDIFDAGQHARNVIIRGGDQGMPSTHRGRGVTKNQFLIIAYRPISLFNVAAATSAAFLEASRV
jgi:hypothetical protein